MAPRTSGDLLADRRFALAEALAAEGDHPAAADLLRQTLDLVPNWAPAWLALGLAHEKAGAVPDAIVAFRRAGDLDPEGNLGAQLHAARLEGTPATMPAAYVRGLFDQYAARFESHLVGQLGYGAPALLAAALERVGPGRLGAVLDLGCGTGLLGKALAASADAIDGVDLSPSMVRQADATGIYRRLFTAELLQHLSVTPAARYQTVVAADVFVYLGPLEDVAARCFRVLAPAGLWGFTTQSLGEPGDVSFGADMRFSHGRGYLERVLVGAGFRTLVLEPAVLRRDAGQPVEGLVVVARRP